MNRATAVIGLIAIAALAAGISTALWRYRPPAVSTAIVMPTPRSLPVVRLSDHHGDDLARERFRDGWDILFFGFTHCPDICPTTLSELRQLRTLLADLDPSRQPRIWLVSVDPERDTPEVLARYLSHFDAGFTGITGSPDQIARFAAGLSVAYQPVPDASGYSMAHTAALFLIDKTASLVALFTAPHDMTRIADDYRILTR